MYEKLNRARKFYFQPYFSECHAANTSITNFVLFITL